MKSRIEFKNEKPYINIDGKLHSPLAYTTYFDECGEFSDFIKNGYRMFFVNVSFTDLPINNVTGFSPFLTGVFEGETPDYNEFDGVVRKIISRSPDALIFPRINIAMPRKWIEENTPECVETPTGRRESLCSEKFLDDGAKLLKELISHIRSSDYNDKIAGYQICGGTTQEWMHHDMEGSFSEMGLEKFRLWMKEKYNINNVPKFPKEDLFRAGFDEIVSRYGEFCCEVAATTVEHFCKVLKNYINNEQIAGVFYGYNAFVNNPLLGLLGLRYIIDSPYIDFFSSPCCYDGNRKFGIDWGDMIPTETVKSHGKLYFVECDIRTSLTRRLQDSRPGKYPDNIYTLTDAQGNKSVWSGPETVDLSISAMRKAFAHQLTKASGVWWFDMWGGWYHHDEIMSEINKMRVIGESSKEKISAKFLKADTVVFIDEKAYFNNPIGSHFCHCVNITRVALGNTGIPFDLCMTEDAEKVLHKYKAAVFTAPLPSESGRKAVEMCKKMNIPYIHTDSEKPHFTTNELRDFLVSEGVHCYNADGNVLYCGGGYVGIHSVNDGVVNISLPSKYKVKQILGTGFEESETDNISLIMNKYDTVLFELI
ncbi:MAG: hypothetical protein E7530_07570 [Ruminococcaceae bacterium]|nr:hypothetical protein [Oscillospiraceae bacterium]